MGLRIVSRDSFLAMAQTLSISQILSDNEISFDITTLKTSGDIKLSSPLYEVSQQEPKEGKAFFTKELEDALLNGHSDLAVHSLKDLPTEVPGGLKLTSFALAENNSDTIICKQALDQKHFFDQINNMTIATSSLRRMAQLKHIFSLCKLTSMRGNVITRLEKMLANTEIDGMVLATAGLKRLIQFFHFWKQQKKNYQTLLAEKAFLSIENDANRIEKLLASRNLHCYEFDKSFYLPAAAQGVLGLETRQNTTQNKQIKKLFSVHSDIAARVNLERKILRALEAGCHLPLGVNIELSESIFKAQVFYSDNYIPGQEPFQVRLLERRLPRENIQVYFNRFIEELKGDFLNVIYCGQNPTHFTHLARQKGYALTHAPLIKATAVEFAEKQLEEEYDMVVVSSQSILSYLTTEQLNNISCQGFLAIGPRTAEALEKLTGKPIHLAQEYNAKGAAQTWLNNSVRGPVLWLGAKAGIKEGITLLRQNEVQVTELELYRNEYCAPTAKAKEQFDQPALVIFTSPSTVRSYISQGLKHPQHFYAALGATTAKEMKQHDLFCYHIASQSEIKTLAEEIFAQSFHQQPKIYKWSLHDEV